LRKGRHVPPRLRGADNPNSKLTHKQVVEIRERLANGEIQDVLAAEYGVHQANISLIKMGKNWR